MRKLVLGLTVACISFFINLSLVNWIAKPYLQLRGREVILKQELRIMRGAIDQYAIDKQALPKSLSDPVDNGYLARIPTDSITMRSDWIIEIGEDTLTASGGKGVIDIRSSAEGEGTDGKDYSEY